MRGTLRAEPKATRQVGGEDEVEEEETSRHVHIHEEGVEGAESEVAGIANDLKANGDLGGTVDANWERSMRRRRMMRMSIWRMTMRM